MSREDTGSCTGKNIVTKTIKICCDGRKEDCNKAVKMASDDTNIVFYMCIMDGPCDMNN